MRVIILLSLGLLTLVEASCHVMMTLNQAYGEVCKARMWQSQAWLSSYVSELFWKWILHPSQVCFPGPPLDCHLMKHLEP